MSFSDLQLPSAPQWDPQQGDLARNHVLYQTELQKQQVDPNQLISAGWTPCPKCGKSWLSPENKAGIEAHGGYYTCPKCKLTSDLLEHLPWHGVAEPDYYPRRGAGGGTAIGLPMADVGQIGENIVRQMGTLPGYGSIVWWHQGESAGPNSSLDGATHDWGIEVKTRVYDAAGHFWDPTGNQDDTVVQRKNDAAAEMGLKGVLGILVLLNFRTDHADVYAKAMPLTPWANARGQMKSGAVKWHKRTGDKIASNIPFESPYKDPASPSPGPYKMADYYKKPQPMDFKPPEPMPF